MPTIEPEVGVPIKESEMALPAPIDSGVVEAALADAPLTLPANLEEEEVQVMAGLLRLHCRWS